MGELTLHTFVSLDGVMQAPGGPGEDERGGFEYGGWVFPHFDEDAGNIINEFFAKAEAFLLGRVTYDIFAGYWPKVTDADDPVAGGLNRLPKFVASRTRDSFEWHNSSHLQGVVEGVGELKRRFDGEVQVHGSGDLAQTLIQHDLIDEYRIMVFPVLLGTGRRLFSGGTVPRTLRLVSSRTTGKGVVVSVYRPAGELVTGGFEG